MPHFLTLRRLTWHALCGGSLLWLTACGGSSGGGGPVPPTTSVVLPSSTSAVWKSVCGESLDTTPPATTIDASLPAARCLNPALYRTTGTRTALVYDSINAGITQQVQQFAMVSEAVTCNGKPAGAVSVREIVESSGSPSGETRFDGTHYFTMSDNRVQLLGTISRYRSQGSAVTQTIMLDPPLTDLDFGLAVGRSTGLDTSAISASVSPPNGPGSASFNASGTVTFVGVETITVPAGTFTDACKFEQRVTTGSPRVTTRWLAKDSGVVLRVESLGTTQRLVSGTLNGVAITP